MSYVVSELELPRLQLQMMMTYLWNQVHMTGSVLHLCIVKHILRYFLALYVFILQGQDSGESRKQGESGEGKIRKGL